MVTFTSLGENDWADLSTSSTMVFPTSAPVSPLAVTSSHLRSSQLHENSCKGIRLNSTLGNTFNKRRLSFLHFYLDDLEKMGLSFFLFFHIAYTKELSDRNEFCLARLNIDKSPSYSDQVNTGGKETLSHARHHDWITSLTECSKMKEIASRAAREKKIRGSWDLNLDKDESGHLAQHNWPILVYYWKQLEQHHALNKWKHFSPKSLLDVLTKQAVNTKKVTATLDKTIVTTSKSIAEGRLNGKKNKSDDGQNSRRWHWIFATRWQGGNPDTGT